MTHLARRLTAAAGIALLAAGCLGTAGSEDTVTLQVFAAASLQEPFEEIGEQFESEHAGVRVRFSFSGSSTLVEQVTQGAPADVLATADSVTMDRLTDSDLAAVDPVGFASNTLRIAVPPGNPAGVTDLASLTGEGLNLVVCAPEVPCGAAAAELARTAGLRLSPVSQEQSVTDVLNKVSTGEADAGLVYTTDVVAAGDSVEGIEVPGAEAAVNRYPITTLRGGGSAELGEEFVEHVLGEDGQQTLAEHGFGAP